MKLQVLQLYLRNLAAPLSSMGVQESALNDLRGSCDILERYGEEELSDFVGLIQQAEEYRKTKELAIPVFLRPVMSVYEKVRALKDRAGAVDGNGDGLKQELLAAGLEDRTKEELFGIATEVGCTVTATATKPALIDAIWTSITGGTKKAGTARKTATTGSRARAAPFDLKGYAQKVSELKERAGAEDSTREELETQIKELNLDKLSQTNLVALARELHCVVSKSTTKAKAIEAIEWEVLSIKETVLSEGR